MCKLCDKADFLIDTMEVLTDWDDIETIIKGEWDRLRSEGHKTPDPDIMNNYFMRYMLICTVATRWAIKHNIGPNTFLSAMHEVAAYQYARDIERRQAIMLGMEDPQAMNEKMKEYDS